MKQNCWEFKRCGRLAGGARAKELGVCPASVNSSIDALNDGTNGGRMCWAVAGTLCGGKPQGSFAKKIDSCMNCEFYKKVRGEEGSGFNFAKNGSRLHVARD
jgi:hypothetical protein